jgi:Domain of unknown function (DUF1835)
MKIHVLAGDALAEDFRKTNVDGEIVVCRECLIEGDLQAASLEDFWNVRAKFIETAYGEPAENYREKVVGEFEKLRSVTQNAAVNLWFEYDLFCQVNMWFCLSLLQNKPSEIYRVAPVVRDETDVWKGFGNLKKEDLEQCYAERVKFSAADVSLGAELWKAFQNKDFDELKKLGAIKSACFPKLPEVCAAAIEIETRPKETLQKIKAADETDFNKVFARFGEIEGVYGFGDSQVKRILEKI